MIIVNTTFVTHPAVSAQVLAWIKDSFLPAALRCGGSSPLVTRVLAPESEGADVTYAVHVSFASLDEADRWAQGVGARMRAILADRYGERALTFHTYLEVTE